MIKAFQLRLYAEMLSHVLCTQGQSEFNTVTFLQAASLILKLFKQQHHFQSFPSTSALERYIEVNIIGNQSELKSRDNRVQMGNRLAGLLASHITYESFFGAEGDQDAFADKLCSDMEQVQFRRIVISSPRDNMTEAFKFSSRHSEFVRLKAEALITMAAAPAMQM